MQVQMQPREGRGKGISRRQRREGRIPAIIYSRGKESEAIDVNGQDFDTAMRQVVKGRLSTTRFTLVDASGRAREVLIKEIQYHPTTYQVLHLDFEELLEGNPINAKVPIELTGVDVCAGVKQGGVLRVVIRSLRVRCLPKDLPEVFFLDVAQLGMRETRRLQDLTIPETLRPLADLNEVAVVIAKR